MGSIVANLGQGISKQLGSFVDLPKITVPNTTIVNRAQCVDPSNDLLPRMGVTRILTQTLEEVQGELGPNGEQVWKLPNDQFDQIRFVGLWGPGIQDNTSGQYLGTSAGADFIEITFYGTGLNILTRTSGTGVAFYDGGSSGPLYGFASLSTILDARNYSEHVIVPVTFLGGITSLPLGLHTVRLNGGPITRISGIEIVAGVSSLQYLPGNAYSGSSKFTNPALITDGYNSNFASGTLGTTGGHVVVYISPDGSVHKAVTPAAASPLYYPSAAHANESVIRSYSFREFGAGRTDDFSTITTARQAVFALDDNVTTLTVTSGAAVFENSTDAIAGVTPGTDNFNFVFVGTGCDVIMEDPDGTGRQWTFLVDASSTIGPFTSSTAGIRTIKVVSGLPYGSHYMRINTVVGGSPRVVRLVVYGPTKPTVPSGSLELCDYYVTANYVAQASFGGSQGIPSQGIISKGPSRELAYVGTWSGGLSQVPAALGGFYGGTTTVGDSVSYSFFGTGIEFAAVQSGGGAGNNWTIQIDGTAYTGSATVGFSGGSATWTPGTSTFFNNGGSGATLQITSLTLGMHTFKATTASGGTSPGFNVVAMNVITPIHSPKANIPGEIQSTLSIGNNAIGDSRIFSTQTVSTLKNWGQATGVSGTTSTTSTAYVPLQDMSVTVRSTGNPIEISFNVAFQFSNTSTADAIFALFVDGQNISGAVGAYGYVQDVATATAYTTVSARRIYPVAAGMHTVQLYWGVSGVTSTLTSSFGNSRVLTVKEIS